jgi:glycine/D-amino acid oxidase-like deaminating enzyme
MVMMNEPAPSLWNASAPDTIAFERLTKTISVDLAVIGGGFSGLSVALHACERGLSVAVLEAQSIGFGASGRNNGQVIPTLSKRDPVDVVARFGKDRGERFLALVRDSAESVFALIRRHAVACDAEQSGWIQPAHTPGRVAISRRRADAWAERGAPAEFLDRGRLSELLGTDAYFGGWMNRSGGHVNPLALVRGMAAVAERLGTRIFINSLAQQIQRRGDCWRVTTPEGVVDASRVVITTNAYSDALWPRLARTIVPVRAWQLATEPLRDNIRATILPGRQAVSDTRGELGYFRYDALGRLVSGGALALPLDADARLRERVGARLAHWFPQLGTPRFEFLWSGHVAMTRDYFPHLHRLADGVFTWLGCNGRGIALGIALGRELARAAAGDDPDDLALPLAPLAPIPLHALVRRVAPPLALWNNRRLDRREVAD